MGGGGGQREGYGGHIWLKPPKMALISEYLAADSSPDASADALAIINNSRLDKEKQICKRRLTNSTKEALERGTFGSPR